MDGALLKPGTVKIDGLREVEHAEFVVAAEADMFGLVFAEARRKVDLQTARLIVDEVRSQAGSRELRSVGVFVDQSPDEVNRIADIAGLDLVQLHGSEPPEFVSLIERPVIRAFRCRPGLSLSQVDAHLAEMARDRFVAALVDGFHPHQPGGSGAGADWSLAEAVARRYPVMLAGGLTPETVGTGIRAVKPLGVDVSSGVEIDGRKDRERMIRFVQAARAGFADVAQSVASI